MFSFGQLWKIGGAGLKYLWVGPLFGARSASISDDVQILAKLLFHAYQA